MRERGGSGREKRRGCGRLRPPASQPARPRGAAGGGGKNTADRDKPREGARRAGPRAGGWRGRGRRSEGEDAPRGARPSAVRRDETEAAPSPSPPPPPGPRCENETGDRVPSPGRVESGLPAPPPTGLGETHPGRAGAGGQARENQREAL